MGEQSFKETLITGRRINCFFIQKPQQTSTICLSQVCLWSANHRVLRGSVQQRYKGTRSAHIPITSFFQIQLYMFLQHFMYPCEINLNCVHCKWLYNRYQTWNYKADIFGGISLNASVSVKWWGKATKVEGQRISKVEKDMIEVMETRKSIKGVWYLDKMDMR